MADKTEIKILKEQLAYYNARAKEYDATAIAEGNTEVGGEWQQLVDAVRALPPSRRTLELACGTGIWTQELLHVSDSIVAVDGAQEMLEVNRAKLGSPKVQYQEADLFNWKPEATYDLVFFGFWLSHVPSYHLDAFLAEAARAVEPGGRLVIVDEPGGGRHASGPAENNAEQTRTLQNGNTFRIVKIYYDVNQLKEKLRGLGFGEVEAWVGDYFFYLNGIRNK